MRTGKESMPFWKEDEDLWHGEEEGDRRREQQQQRRPCECGGVVCCCWRSSRAWIQGI
jgi:hypothetical protein